MVPGLVLLLIFFIAQVYSGNLVSKIRRNTVKITDERVGSMNEILTAIKLVKLYAWEDSFSKKISDLRKNEISQFKKQVPQTFTTDHS